MIKRPKTVEAYVSLVDQAIDEVEELRFACEYDGESMGTMPFLEPLEQMVKELRQSMADGSYQFENEDLNFIAVVDAAPDRQLPFKFLFRMINETHRKGLGVEEEEE